MAEVGIVARGRGTNGVEGLAVQVSSLPQATRLPLGLLFAKSVEAKAWIDRLTDGIEEIQRDNEVTRRLTSIREVRVLIATETGATTPDVGT